jgi:uncharacterized protein CbrC (UPF0167 family)
MLPLFLYHPDPVATGSVKQSAAKCVCCGEARGFIYCASVYGGSDIRDRLCPWCIANGKAAARYDCFFSVEDPLVAAGLPRAVIIEVTRRTPGYNSWQQEEWQVCCDDACEFHGDATVVELAELEGERLARVQGRWHFSAPRWSELLRNYIPGGGVAMHRFVCRHCGEVLYALDLA